MKPKYLTTSTTLEYATSYTPSLPVLQYDGGSVKQFTKSDLIAGATVNVGYIMRYNGEWNKLTLEESNHPAVGVVVAWDAQRNIGAYQYDGVVTLRVTQVLSEYHTKQWSEWNRNYASSFDPSVPSSAVGWVLATFRNIVRIQIDPH